MADEGTVHCRTGSLEKTNPARRPVRTSSLPHRQLRKLGVCTPEAPNASLPHRQLRNGSYIITGSVLKFTAAQAA